MFLLRGEKNVLRVLEENGAWMTGLGIIYSSERAVRWRDRVRRGSVYVWLTRLKNDSLVASRSESDDEYYARLALIKHKNSQDWKRRTLYALTVLGRERAQKIK